MSANIDTYLWLSPADYVKPKVRSLLEDAGFGFEYDDDITPDEDGTIKLDCRNRETYAVLEELTGLNVSFLASYDPRLEGDGDRCRWIAHAMNFVFMQEDGCGNPVVEYKQKSGLNKERLRMAARYWKLYGRARAAWEKLKKHTHNCGRTGVADTVTSCVLGCGCWCHADLNVELEPARVSR